MNAQVMHSLAIMESPSEGDQVLMLLNKLSSTPLCRETVVKNKKV